MSEKIIEVIQPICERCAHVLCPLCAEVGSISCDTIVAINDGEVDLCECMDIGDCIPSATQFATVKVIKHE